MKLKVAVFLCGASVMILELVGSRIIAPLFGNSLFVWGSLIGVVLAALSLGYFYGGKVADKKPNFKTLAIVILQAGVATMFIPLLSSLILVPEFAALFGMKYGPLISVLILFSAPSFFLGMVSPYAVKLETEGLKFLGNTAGSLYALSTLGSIVGTLLTAFFLIPELGVRAIVYATGLLLILAAFMVFREKKFLPAIAFSLFIFFVMVATSPWYASASEPGYVILHQEQTPYHQVTIKEEINSHQRLMKLDASPTGGMDKNGRGIYRYTDYFHLPLVLNPEIKQVLFIGCGAGTGPKKFHKNYPQVKIDVVDIDPVVMKLAKKYFHLKQDNRLKFHAQDGRVFLSQRDKKYDLVAIDAFSSVYSIPFHLMTQEFLQELKQHLTQNGTVVLNVISSIKGEPSKIFKAEYKTYQEVFPTVYVFPVKENHSQIQNIMIIASKSDQKYSKSEWLRKANISHEKIKIPQLIPYSQNYLEKNISTEDVPVLTDNYAPVDILLKPVIESLYFNPPLSNLFH